MLMTLVTAAWTVLAHGGAGIWVPSVVMQSRVCKLCVLTYLCEYAQDRKDDLGILMDTCRPVIS